MKYVLSILILTINIYCFGQEKCPVNFDADSLNTAKKYPWLWVGKIVALEGRVVEVRRSHARPYYFLDIGRNKTIGVGSAMDDNTPKNHRGDTVRVLGYFLVIDVNDHTHRINTDEYHIMSICTVNTATQEMQVYNEKQVQVTTWMSGSVPLADN